MGIATFNQTFEPVDVLLGEWTIHLIFAGLTPQYAGLYQVNFVMPAEATAGTYLLRLATPDALSKLVSLFVQ